jgi:hypothetical protein
MRSHVVQPGESAADIAARYRISEWSLRLANSSKPTTVEATPQGKKRFFALGATIRIPTGCCS